MLEIETEALHTQVDKIKLIQNIQGKKWRFAGRKARKCIQGREEAGGPTQEDNKTGNAHIIMVFI